jgi:hypothetical protein
MIFKTAGVVIGFMNAPYQVMENESFVTVTFGVMSGDLERDIEVAVELSFLDGTAVGESLMFKSSLAGYEHLMGKGRPKCYWRGSLIPG